MVTISSIVREDTANELSYHECHIAITIQPEFEVKFLSVLGQLISLRNGLQ